MKIRVSSDLCCGAQRCQIVSPDVYRIEGGFNVLAGGDDYTVPADLEKSAIRGARACPESAITIITDEG